MFMGPQTFCKNKIVLRTNLSQLYEFEKNNILGHLYLFVYFIQCMENKMKNIKYHTMPTIPK